MWVRKFYTRDDVKTSAIMAIMKMRDFEKKQTMAVDRCIKFGIFAMRIALKRDSMRSAKSPNFMQWDVFVLMPDW